jgi:hypothetical protein
VSAASQSD